MTELMTVATSGSSATLLISGDAGLGKTALMKRALELARQKNMQVLHAVGERLEIPRAFGPFIDALTPRRSNSPLVEEALTGLWRQDKSGIPQRSHEERFEAHRAFLRAISEIADKSPVLLALDDLHWMDNSSLELFAYVARRLRHGVLLLGSFRPDELAQRSALSRAIRDIPSDQIVEVVLRPLTDDEIRRALRLTLGGSIAGTTRRTRELIQSRSRGNPLFLEELLRSLARRGALTRNGDAWRITDLTAMPLPASVADTVHERSQQVSAEAWRLLGVAALIGERFELQVLEMAGQVDERAVLETLRSAVALQLVEDASGPTGPFAFRHALVRDAIAEGLLTLERREIHRRIAHALELSGSIDTLVARIAYHYTEAGDRDRAFAAHKRAGEIEAARGADAEAFRHFEQARALAPDDDRVIADIAERISNTAASVGDRRRLLSATAEAIRAYAAVGDVRAQARMILHLRNIVARHLVWPLSRAEALSREAEALLSQFGDTPELVWLNSGRVLIDLKRGNPDAARAIGAAMTAVSIADRIAPCWERGTAYWHLAHMQYEIGDLENVEKWLRKASDFATSSPDNGRMAMDVATTSELLRFVRNRYGETDEARALVARVAQLRERYDRDMIWDRLHQQLYEPNWDAFVELHEEWAADELNETIYYAHMGLHRSFVDVARGDARALERAYALNQEVLGHEEVSDVGTFYVAEVGLLAGDYELALRALEPAAPFVAHPRWYHAYLTSAAILALLAAEAMGDDSVAQRWIDRVSWRKIGPPLSWSADVRQTRWFVDAELYWRNGEVDHAIAELDRVLNDQARNEMVEQWQSRSNPISTHFIVLRQVRWLVARDAPGDRERAGAMFGSIAAFYRTASATWYLTRLREQAAQLGLRFEEERSKARPVLGLTRRELEVASLVAKGLTNREIAQRLTLSARTAESHVDRIREKLGFRTRAQIAAWIGDQGS